MSGSEEGKSHELVIIRRRASEDEGKHHGGVWKIAYADFMTAMMAFFLVMWLINSTDKKTLTQVATYFNPLRLTDKRPSPKGLEEPDGNEGRVGSPEPAFRVDDEPRPGVHGHRSHRAGDPTGGPEGTTVRRIDRDHLAARFEHHRPRRQHG